MTPPSPLNGGSQQLRKLHNRTLFGTPMNIVWLTISYRICFMACRLLFQCFKNKENSRGKKHKWPILAKWGGGSYPPIGKRAIYFHFLEVVASLGLAVSLSHSQSMTHFNGFRIMEVLVVMQSHDFISNKYIMISIWYPEIHSKTTAILGCQKKTFYSMRIILILRHTKVRFWWRSVSQS